MRRLSEGYWIFLGFLAVVLFGGGLIFAAFKYERTPNHIVIQNDDQGRPVRCWELLQTKTYGGGRSIVWYQNGERIEIQQFSHIEVREDDWESGFKQLGISREACAEIQAKRYDPKTGLFQEPSRNGR